MRAPRLVRRAREIDPLVLDALLALALLALSQLEFWLLWSPAEQGSKGTKLLAIVLASIPLVWRRRAPLAVVGLVIVGIAADGLSDVPGTPLGVGIGAMVATYSVAAYAPAKAAAAGLALVLATVLIRDVRDPQLNDTDVPLDLLLFGAIWAIGWAMGRRKRRADELERRATWLERDREEKARAAVADERARIARELHDVVAHAISVMVVQVQAAQRVLDGEQASARESLAAVEKTGRQALVEMRRLLGVLRKEDRELALAPRPSLTQLDALVSQFREAGLPVELHVDGEPVSLSVGVELSAYRIVQEALTNALKHAGPARARVIVRYLPHALEVEISDNGRGPVDGAAGGHGLVGMRERAALVGGALESGPANDRGYVVRASLPT